MTFSVMTPTKKSISKKPIFGFDIETYDNNKKFLCGSITGEFYKKLFFTKDALIKELSHNRFRNAIIAATNLSFDFFGVFYKNPSIKEFLIQFRGSDLIYAKTYLDSDGSFSYNPGKKRFSLTFLDTMNYARLSVQKMGKILRFQKLEKPHFLGHRPTTMEEWDQMIRYNLRDSEISRRFMEFLRDSFQKLGSSFKNTIASSSMSLFRNIYLKKSYFTHDADMLLEMLKGYYGGRCECFKRGYSDQKHFYYDFNSLYPAVMHDEEFPEPDSIRPNKINDISYIEAYEGFATVDIECPKDVFPLLPFRLDKKLIFPQGSFSGTYTNAELRKAMHEGYIIKKIHKNIYFKRSCRPFQEFVDDLYDKRQKYKETNNPMEYVVKIMMNSLYGKFGEKFENRENVIPLPKTTDDLLKYNYIEPIKDTGFVRVVMDMVKPRVHCFPEWCSYVTAYGRMRLYDILKRSDPVYCDTDSIITRKSFGSSDSLGKLKIEHIPQKMIIVKPKLYMMDTGKERIFKGKGIGFRMCMEDFGSILDGNGVSYKRILRFKESIRRGFIPNEVADICKKLTLEDNKRIWEEPFSISEMQVSTPICLNKDMHDIIKNPIVSII